MAAVSSCHRQPVTEAVASILHIQGTALKCLGVTEIPPQAVVSFGLGRLLFCPQRVILLLPHFLRANLASENMVPVFVSPER